MSEGNDLLQTTLDSILAKLESVSKAVKDLESKTAHLTIEGEGHTAGTSSNKSQQDLSHEQASTRESSELPNGSSINENYVDIKVLTTESLLQKIENNESWEDVQVTDEQSLSSMHQGLVDCAEIRKKPLTISSDHKPISSSDAIETFEKQLNQMKEDNHLESFIIQIKDTTFTQHDPKEIFLTLYQTMANVKKEQDAFHLVPIAFVVATIAAAGGFDFSDSKQGDILRTLAIESKIYLNVNELYQFTRELKRIVFNFLMKDLGWKRHEELDGCKTLKNIIDAVDYIKAIPMHPSLKFVQLSKNSRGNLTLNSIVDGTSEAISERYERNKVKKGRFTKDDKLWIDKPLVDALDKLQDDSITSPERDAIVERIKEQLDGMNRMIVEYDIFHWVSQLKLAVFDEKLKPKINEFWVELNKQIDSDPTQNLNAWSKRFMGQYTELSNSIDQGQIYNLMQASFQQANSKPMDKIPDFKIPVDYSLNAAVTTNTSKGKNKGKNNRSNPKKAEDLSTNQPKKK